MATCKDTPGSYQCQCKPGYQGNGKVCKGTMTSLPRTQEVVFTSDWSTELNCVWSSSTLPPSSLSSPLSSPFSPCLFSLPLLSLLFSPFFRFFSLFSLFSPLSPLSSLSSPLSSPFSPCLFSLPLLSLSFLPSFASFLYSLLYRLSPLLPLLPSHLLSLSPWHSCKAEIGLHDEFLFVIYKEDCCRTFWPTKCKISDEMLCQLLQWRRFVPDRFVLQRLMNVQTRTHVTKTLSAQTYQAPICVHAGRATKEMERTAKVIILTCKLSIFCVEKNQSIPLGEFQ